VVFADTIPIYSAIRSVINQGMGWLFLGAAMFVAWKIRGYVVNAGWACSVKKTVGDITQVVERLAELRAHMGAERAYVLQFHNGCYFVNGSPILRMSCTHESVAPGVAPIKNHSKDIMVNHVLEAVSFLSEFERGSLPAVRQVSSIADCFYKSVVVSQGAETIVQYPLYKNTQVIGMLVVDFHESTTPTKSLLAGMRDLAPQVEYLVNNSKEETSLWENLFWGKGQR